MRGLLLIAAAAALLGACDSSGCGGAPEKQSSGESTSMSGGGGGHGGGLGEAVSFQGIGKKQEPPPANGTGQPQQAAPAAGSGSPGANAAAAAPSSSQSVICGGFPGLPVDCLKDPRFDAVKKKCCPTGQVETCQGIPGGARLVGRGCAAPAK